MPVFQNPHLRPWDIKSQVCSAYQEPSQKLRVVVWLKTDTVHREGGHRLHSHSQTCAAPKGQGSTRVHRCSRHQAITLTAPVCNPPSREGVTLLFPHRTRCYRHTLRENPRSRSSPELCTASGLHTDAQETQLHRIATLPTTDTTGEGIYNTN